MCRTAISLAALMATLVLAGPAVLAQPGEAARSRASSGSGSQQPQEVSLTENFENEPLDGWEYSCQHALIKAGTGRALATRGGGHAMWVAAGQVGDFALKLRYGYEKGVGDIFFRSTETPRGMEFYFLRLEPSQLVLGRRLHTMDHQYPEKLLAATSVPLSPRAWHEVIIQAAGGQISVWLDGQGILQVQDPQPLGAGLCGLGVTANSGFVLYDDVALITKDGSGGRESGDNLANWPSLSSSDEIPTAGLRGHVPRASGADVSLTPRIFPQFVGDVARDFVESGRLTTAEFRQAAMGVLHLPAKHVSIGGGGLNFSRFAQQCWRFVGEGEEMIQARTAK